MAKVKKLTREFIAELREDIMHALSPIEDAYGLTFELGNFRFGEKTAAVRLTTVVAGDDVSEDGIDGTYDAETFRNKCRAYGLMPEDLGREFLDSQGKRYKVAGLRTRAAKYPIVAIEVETGSKYRFSARRVGLALGRASYVE